MLLSLLLLWVLLVVFLLLGRAPSLGVTEFSVTTSVYLWNSPRCLMILTGFLHVSTGHALLMEGIFF